MRFLSLAALLLVTAPLSAAQAQYEKAPLGGAYTGDGGESTFRDLGEIYPSWTAQNAEFVANGVALRNRSSGAIELSCIPERRRIKKAFLYWNWAALDYPVPGKHNSMGFWRLSPHPKAVGITVHGQKCGFGDQPGWFPPQAGYLNFTYRADVTQFVTGNGLYAIVPVSGSVGSTSGADPWKEPPVAPLLNGATLVVIFEGVGTVFIYDKAHGNGNALCSQTFWADPGARWCLVGMAAKNGYSGKLALINSDGQSSPGWDACTTHPDFTRESVKCYTPLYPPLYLSGPGSEFHNSDFNGCDGQPCPQLWDTAVHDISPLFAAVGGTVTKICCEVTQSPGPFGVTDTVIPVANVLHVAN